MSFVRTLATLAAGFAAAKGYDKYQKMGGMEGVREAMRKNPQLAGLEAQMGQMLEKFGMADGAAGLEKMMGQMGGAAGQAGGAAAAGLGGLMAALGGAQAAGAEKSAEIMDAMTGSRAVTTTMEENAKLMIRAMIQAAKADGEIDDEERAKIIEQMGELEPGEIEFVQAELARPVDVAALAADTGEAMKAQVYAMSLMAVRVDRASEAAYLDQLAAALGLSEETRARVHASMGLG